MQKGQTVEQSALFYTLSKIIYILTLIV